MWSRRVHVIPCSAKALGRWQEKPMQTAKVLLLGLGNGPGTNRSVSPTNVENQVRASQRSIGGALWTNKLLGFAFKAQKAAVWFTASQTTLKNTCLKPRPSSPPIPSCPPGNCYIINSLVCIPCTMLQYNRASTHMHNIVRFLFFFFFNTNPSGNPISNIFIKHLGTSLMVQWLRLCAPNVRGWSSTPGQETRFHMPQPRLCTAK